MPTIWDNIFGSHFLKSISSQKNHIPRINPTFFGFSLLWRVFQPGEEPRGVGDVVDVRLVDVDHP